MEWKQAKITKRIRSECVPQHFFVCTVHMKIVLHALSALAGCWTIVPSSLILAVWCLVFHHLATKTIMALVCMFPLYPFSPSVILLSCSQSNYYSSYERKFHSHQLVKLITLLPFHTTGCLRRIDPVILHWNFPHVQSIWDF